MLASLLSLWIVSSGWIGNAGVARRFCAIGLALQRLRAFRFRIVSVCCVEETMFDSGSPVGRNRQRGTMFASGAALSRGMWVEVRSSCCLGARGRRPKGG